jgi:hypothetical protein
LIDYDENEIFKSSISKIIFLLIRCFGWNLWKLRFLESFWNLCGGELIFDLLIFDKEFKKLVCECCWNELQCVWFLILKINQKGLVLFIDYIIEMTMNLMLFYWVKRNILI